MARSEERPRRVATIATVGGAVVVVVVWLAMRETDTTFAIAEPELAREGSAPRADDAIAPVELEDPLHVLPLAPVRSVTANPQSSETLDLGAAHVRLVVGVEPAEAEAHARLIVLATGPGANGAGSVTSVIAAAQRDDDGYFRVDVTEAFRDPSRWPTSLRVECPLSLHIGQSTARVPLIVDGDALTPELLARLREVELRATLTGAIGAIVRGRVRPPGTPRQSFDVAMIPADADGAPESFVLASGWHLMSEAFEVRCKPGFELWIVVTMDGWRPCAKYLGRVNEGVFDVGELALEAGETIRGRVAASGTFSGIEARISVDGHSRAREIGRELIWTGLSVEWSSVTVPIGANGEFEVTGLAPMQYRLAPAIPERAHEVDACSSLVEAPVSGVSIAPDVVLVKLQFHEAGRPLSSTRVAWSGVEWDALWRSGEALTGNSGRTALWMTPGAKVRVSIAGRELDVEAGAVSDAAWRVIDL